MDTNELFEHLEVHGIATEDELRLVTDINGYSEGTLKEVLFARTGYSDWEQYREEYLEDNDE